MQIIIQDTAHEIIETCARSIARLLTEKPACVLGLATGSSPILLYQRLIQMDLDWHLVTTFNLDEYVGLSPDHPQSYHHFMQENLFRHINIKPENINIPNGLTQNILQTCADYEQKIRDVGGIDLQLLGIGTNGHIGFNEPSSSLASRTRIKTLMPQTRQDNARFFNNEADIPHHVITMGIGTIMEARHNLLLALGETKAKAVALAVEGAMTANHPASILQMHPNATFFLDTPAAAQLKNTAYYKWTYANKPDDLLIAAKQQ